jgi:hypothetical protein
MSEPSEAEDVKLICSLFSPQKSMVEEVSQEMTTLFGTIDWSSPDLFFDRTRYYAREMGWPLHRRFIAFKDLIRPDDLVTIKLKTNELERKHLQEENKRAVNIDPGYISLERLILATGKNYTHRIYLSRGIFADLTLLFQRGSFRPLEWTYRDYAEEKVIGYFNGIREIYKAQLRGVDQ